ncbi:calcium-binding protein [Rahnella aquatilis]
MSQRITISRYLKNTLYQIERFVFSRKSAKC